LELIVVPHGEMNGTHSTASEKTNQPVRPNPPASHIVILVQFGPWNLYERGSWLITGEQRVQFVEQRWITLADLIEELLTVLRRDEDCLLKQFLDLCPPFGVHVSTLEMFRSDCVIFHRSTPTPQGPRMARVPKDEA